MAHIQPSLYQISYTYASDRWLLLCCFKLGFRGKYCQKFLYFVARNQTDFLSGLITLFYPQNIIRPWQVFFFASSLLLGHSAPCLNTISLFHMLPAWTDHHVFWGFEVLKDGERLTSISDYKVKHGIWIVMDLISVMHEVAWFILMWAANINTYRLDVQVPSSRQCNCDITSHKVTVKRIHVVWLGSAPLSTPCQMNIITISKTVVKTMIALLCSEWMFVFL